MLQMLQLSHLNVAMITHKPHVFKCYKDYTSIYIGYLNVTNVTHLYT